MRRGRGVEGVPLTVSSICRIRCKSASFFFSFSLNIKLGVRGNLGGNGLLVLDVDYIVEPRCVDFLDGEHLFTQVTDCVVVGG
jgi:hypothetical protein